MDFKKIKSLLPLILIGVLAAGFTGWKIISALNPTPTDMTTQVLAPVAAIKHTDVVTKPVAPDAVMPVQVPDPMTQQLQKVDNRAFEQQFDLERQHQREIKDEKIKLEQLNLQLEQEKTIADINKLKKENAGAYNEPTSEGQNNLPEVRINYIGGNSVVKEAIVDMAGTSYNVKEKSSLTDDVKVVSISDTSVTLHFTEPVNLTKTFDFKPE